MSRSRILAYTASAHSYSTDLGNATVAADGDLASRHTPRPPPGVRSLGTAPAAPLVTPAAATW